MGELVLTLNTVKHHERRIVRIYHTSNRLKIQERSEVLETDMVSESQVSVRPISHASDGSIRILSCTIFPALLSGSRFLLLFFLRESKLRSRSQ